MTFDWKPLFLLAALVAFGALAFWYHGRAADEKQRADAAEHNLKLANDTISDMQTRQRDVAALDAKYTKELADAQENINQLERDIANGNKRLRLAATCGKNGATSTTGVDDGTGPRLTDAAERDYFTLRQRIEIVTKQLTGLQAYVREQCLK
ncbi:lysis protein [Cronobacter sakazakii]|nr:lysis protein [Cronobacter sakazakii]EJO9495126.1 lysis protein [Cronobacter sakazakii]EJP5820331.1 lysis protein [Cronobacter sakazakii]EJP5829017.1 lysis protein [Cronobacter sakazakii]EJQ8004695.1 lysis protein [Cronobacter sakazakii]